jgi:hypothetical protein
LYNSMVSRSTQVRERQQCKVLVEALHMVQYNNPICPQYMRLLGS